MVHQYKYNKLIKTNDMSINYRQRFLNQIKLDLEKDVEYKKKMIDIILNKPDLKHYYEETVEGKKIENIFKKLQENPNTHIDEYYNIFAKKLENDIAELEHFNDINKKSINTDKMLKSCKSETNKFEMCKNIQLLLNEQHDDLNSNLYTLFYILPDFIKSYSESAYIIRCMMNRILSEFQLRRRSLEARAKDTQPTTIFQNSLNGFDKFEQYEKEILENTDIFYDFAFFKDQKKFELNTTGFSYLFMSCLDQLFNKNPINIYEQSLFNVNKYGEIFINPAKFMSMIGKIVPNIKITYIVNSCRETNTDNPEFIVSSLENTPNVSPSGTPRQLGKKSLDKSPSDSQNETRRVSPGIKEKSLTPGGSRRGKFRRSTRRKRSNKSYRKYSIGNKKQTKYK
jgi:hypothetical protein